MTNFSIKEAFKKAWELTKENILVLIGLTSIIAVISWILHVWAKGMERSLQEGDISKYALFIFIYIITLFLSMLAQIGYIKILLKLYDGEEVNPRDIFGYHNLLWNFLLQSILYGVIVIVGFILLIIPGIIFIIKYGYASYFVIDQNMKPIDAMKASSRITYGNKWKIALFGICILAANILGGLLFVVCLLVTMPLTALASIHVFRILSGTIHTQQELELDEKK